MPMGDAIKTVRPALADFYSSLTDEQKARFKQLGATAGHVSSGMKISVHRLNPSGAAISLFG